ncbi:MAG: BlaI/MecI/CopY family transcriptional regulator [Bacteroidaceae bacterium]|nr:BlaI/MecI/CopY family transcriptional regulator [Bacteroidaceae bacterium]
MRELTRAELQVMQILWDKEQAMTREVLEAMPEPKPAFNTVSTVIRVLETKGFVSHKAFGTTYLYFPVVQRGEYTSRFMNNVMQNFFGGSRSAFISFFVQQEQMTEEEMEELHALMKKVEARKTGM